MTPPVIFYKDLRDVFEKAGLKLEGECRMIGRVPAKVTVTPFQLIRYLSGEEEDLQMVGPKGTSVRVLSVRKALQAWEKRLGQ